MKEISAALNGTRERFTALVSANGLDWEREIGFVRQALSRDERLRKCSQESIVAAVTNIAAVGLSLNPIKQHAALIARWNDKKGCYEASLVVQYRGLIHLAAKAGVTHVVADVVYSADHIEIHRTEQGDHFVHRIAVHVPRDGESNKFIGVYVAARMPGSQLPKVEWVPAADIYAMRDQSESYRDKNGNVRPDSPWNVWFDEMAKKSGTKRAQKRWEESISESAEWERFQRAVQIDNESEGVIDAKAIEPEPTLTVDDVAQIEKLASEMWPGKESKAVARICAAYKASALNEIPLRYKDEILRRIQQSGGEQ